MAVQTLLHAVQYRPQHRSIIRSRGAVRRPLVDSTSLRAWVGEFVCYEVTRQREAVERSGQVTRKSERGRSRAEVHTLGAGGACYWVSVSREAFGSSTDADAGARGNYRQLSERGERAA